MNRVSVVVNVGLVLGLSAGLAPVALASSSGFCSSMGHGVVVSPRYHQWYACDNGRVVRTGAISAGRGFCPDTGRRCYTPTGSFRVLSKGGAGCKSTRYPVGRGGAPMPYCMFFTSNYALHGSYDVPKNYNASHGCVRMHPQDARWLNQDFLNVGDRVVVTSY